MNQTYIPNHNLTNDDRIHIDLDERFFLKDATKRFEFNALAEGICELRLKHSDRGSISDSKIDSKKKFKLPKHLGDWEMNQILDIFLKSKETLSVNKDFENFMNLVQENKEKGEYRTKSLPYIDTYYYDILKYPKKWQGDLQKSREKNSDTGKKYMVIMLALLRDYNLKASTPYVGYRQIMSLCSSTRDFLKIMEALFNVRMEQTSLKNLSDFYSFEANLTQKEIKAQTEAVVRVANDKYEGIKNKYGTGKVTERMNLFIESCGNILYDLQAKRELSSLTSEEKRIFTVSFKDDVDGNLLKFLKASADDTYIKILNEITTSEMITVEFELARIFAPKYKISFRQTQQNKIKLDGEILKKLCICIDDSCEQISKKLIDNTESVYRSRPKLQQKTFDDV